jgi:hypothetical protein
VNKSFINVWQLLKYCQWWWLGRFLDTCTFWQTSVLWLKASGRKAVPVLHNQLAHTKLAEGLLDAGQGMAGRSVLLLQSWKRLLFWENGWHTTIHVNPR